MTKTLLLAWRYLIYHRVRTGILVACIALIGFLPIAVEVLIAHYEETLTARAARTPLLVGAKGSRFDLLLNSLYFKGRLSELISMAEFEPLRADPLAQAIPLYLRHTARGHPIVGTSIDYFEFRELRLARGTLPLILGDAVLGASLASALELGPGDHLISDTEKLYDLSASYPLRLRITGVLAKSGTSDDGAVFVDTRTAWIISGIGHGHQNVDENTDPSLVLDRTDGHVATNAAIFEYTEITPDNMGEFHFHGGPEQFPLTAIIVIPKNRKSATILKGRFGGSKTVQPLVPEDGLAELMDIVFQVKRFFDANLALVSLATALFLSLIIWLSLRVRQREIETLFKLGCSRSTVFRIQATELLLVLGAGLLAAVTLAYVLSELAIRSSLVF